MEGGESPLESLLFSAAVLARGTTNGVSLLGVVSLGVVDSLVDTLVTVTAGLSALGLATGVLTEGFLVGVLVPAPTVLSDSEVSLAGEYLEGASVRAAPVLSAVGSPSVPDSSELDSELARACEETI